MAIAEQDLHQTFDSLDPATGEVVGTHPVHTRADVDEAVARARQAAKWWRGLGFDGRKRRLQAFKAVLANRQDELCEVIHAESGKPIDDARLELILAIDHMDWAARNAEKVLGRQKRSTTLNLVNHRAFVEYLPVGVVGVIGPWNYPVHTPMGSVTYALAAGNAVVFKPSEYTPGVGEWLVNAFAEIVGEYPVLQLLTGDGSTGNALCLSDIDVLAFTGSAATGRKVMKACAENLTKVVMECGGNDAMIVTADADLDAAADAAVWGSCSNAGQTCAGVERVYVDARVYDDFLAKTVAAAKDLRAGSEATDQFGPITMPSQIGVISEHLADALDRGAKAVVGGLESVRPPYVDPVVLVDVPDDARIMREETFGPILPIMKVNDIGEAIRRTNDSVYGLGASVFAGTSGVAIARQLEVGMVSVNSVVTYAGLPSVPFGGRGESGFGRIHGDDGLKEFAQPRAITVKRFDVPGMNITTFARSMSLMTMIGKATKLVHGRRG